MRGSPRQANKKAKFGQMFSRNGARNKRHRAHLPLRRPRRLVRRRSAGLPVGRARLDLPGSPAAFSRCGSSATASSRRQRQACCAAASRKDMNPTAGLRRSSPSSSPPCQPGIVVSLEHKRRSIVVVAGLIVFSVVFALNSAVHSHHPWPTDSDKVGAMNVGFTTRRTPPAVLPAPFSGALYQWGARPDRNNGLIAGLWASTAFVVSPACCRCSCRAASAHPADQARRVGRLVSTRAPAFSTTVRGQRPALFCFRAGSRMPA